MTTKKVDFFSSEVPVRSSLGSVVRCDEVREAMIEVALENNQLLSVLENLLVPKRNFIDQFDSSVGASRIVLTWDDVAGFEASMSGISQVAEFR